MDCTLSQWTELRLWVLLLWNSRHYRLARTFRIMSGTVKPYLPIFNRYCRFQTYVVFCLVFHERVILCTFTKTYTVTLFMKGLYRGAFMKCSYCFHFSTRALFRCVFHEKAILRLHEMAILLRFF